MTNFYKNNKEVLKVAENSGSVETKTIAKIFEKIKQNGILAKPIEISMNKINEIEKKTEKDFIDQIILYRNKKGYSARELSQKMGIGQSRIALYELRITKLNDPKIINGFIKALDIKNPKLTDYQKFLLDEPKEKVRKYLSEHKISFEKMGRLLNIKRQTLQNWIMNENVIIKEETFEKIKKNYNKLFNKEKNKDMEEDEELE